MYITNISSRHILPAFLKLFGWKSLYTRNSLTHNVFMIRLVPKLRDHTYALHSMTENTLLLMVYMFLKVNASTDASSRIQPTNISRLREGLLALMSCPFL